MAPAASEWGLGRETDGQAAELAALLRLLDISAGAASLNIAVCNSPVLRDYLIDRLKETHADLAVVALPRGCVDVYGEVMGRAAEKKFSAVFVTGIEHSVSSELQAHPALKSLNASRDLWESRFPCPVVFWMPAYVAALIPVLAPDFWRYRSHGFEFAAPEWTPESASGEELGSEVALASNLDRDQVQFRIADLEQQFEHFRWPPSDSVFPYALLCLSELGYLYARVGKLAEAESLFDKALDLCVSRDWKEGAAVQHGNLGNIAAMRGELDAAEFHYRTALDINEHSGRLEGQAANLGNLGIIERRRGNLDAAEKYGRLALEINQNVGRAEGEATDLGNLGLIAVARGELDTAGQRFRDALAINQKLARREGQATQLLNLGNILLARGDLGAAEQLYRESLEINQLLGRIESQITCIGNLAGIAELRGDQSGARELWSKVRELSESFGMADRVAKAQRKLDALPGS